MIDIQITMPDGSITRVRKVSPVPTRRGAEQYEREVRAALLEGTRSSKEEQPPAVPTLASFFIDTYATTNNRPSTVREKRRTLGRGCSPSSGAFASTRSAPVSSRPSRLGARRTGSRTRRSTRSSPSFRRSSGTPRRSGR